MLNKYRLFAPMGPDVKTAVRSPVPAALRVLG